MSHGCPVTRTHPVRPATVCQERETMAASTETIFRALETSIFALPEMPGRWEVLHFPGVRAHATPQTSHPIGNLVGVSTLAAANADAVIAHVRDFFVAR